MKIIFLNRYFLPDESATSRMVSSLATALAQQNWSVHVITGRHLHDDVSRTLPAAEEISGVKVHRIQTTWFGRGKLVGRALDYVTFHAGAFWRLLRLTGRGDVCVVCTDPPLLSVTALLPVKWKGGVLVNWIMDLFPEVATELGVLPQRGFMTRACLWLRDLSVRGAWSNIAPTERMARFLRERQVPESRVGVINHWSDGDAIRPMAREACTLRKEWNLEDKFVIGYSGNLGRAHEFDTILNAAALLSHRSDIVFLFVGGGHRRAAVEARVRELALPNVMMKPLQPRARLAECLAVPDVHLVSLLPEMEHFIVPSKFYGIAAAGRPTLFVGDAAGEIATLLRKANCGASVRIGEAEELSRWILELAHSPSLRTSLGKNARALFDTSFSEARGVADWSRLMASAASRESALVPLPTTGSLRP